MNKELLTPEFLHEAFNASFQLSVIAAKNPGGEVRLEAMVEGIAFLIGYIASPDPEQETALSCVNAGKAHIREVMDAYVEMREKGLV